MFPRRLLQLELLKIAIREREQFLFVAKGPIYHLQLAFVDPAVEILDRAAAGNSRIVGMRPPALQIALQLSMRARAASVKYAYMPGVNASVNH